MHSISPNLNLMIKSCEKVSMTLKRDFGELENLQVSLKGPNNFVTNSDKKVENINRGIIKSKKNIHSLLRKVDLLKMMIPKIFGLLIRLMALQIFYMVCHIFVFH